MCVVGINCRTRLLLEWDSGKGGRLPTEGHERILRHACDMRATCVRHALRHALRHACDMKRAAKTCGPQRYDMHATRIRHASMHLINLITLCDMHCDSLMHASCKKGLSD